MYKVLIVDDEPIVREGMRGIIPWEDYGYEVVGVATDGNSALEECKILFPDLIISDIRMAGMNGLEFIKRLREYNSTIECLILSGYSDFDYARKAIQSNVAGYLLKPIDEEELIEYLIRVKSKLDENQKATQISKHGEERQCELFILSILGNEGYEDNEILKSATKFGINWGKYEVLLIRLEETDGQKSSLLCLKKEIQKLIKDDQMAIAFLNEPFLGILLNSTSYKKRERQILFNEIKDVMESNDRSFTAALGVSVDNILNINESNKAALQLLYNRFFFNKNELLSEGKEVIKRTKSESVDINAVIEKLYLALDIGVYETVESTINDISYVADNIYSETETKRNYVYVLSSVLNKLQNSKSERESYISTVSEKVLEIYQHGQIDELQNFVKSLLKGVYDELEYTDTDDQLKKLLILIENRYNENLKLEKLAELFNYNSAYLGKLFKIYTGEYFNTYLDKVRIKNAKKLLLEGFKVYRVAEIVGYNNVDYFHSKFKKYVGVSPSAYRK